MRFDDLVRVSLRQVVRYRRRYWGVVLAVALGVAGLIAVVTTGQEVKKTLNQDLELIGGITVVRAYYENFRYDNFKNYRLQWFSDTSIQALRRLPGVMEVSPVASTWIQAARQKEYYRLQVIAVDQTFWQVRNLWAVTGQLFGADAVNSRRCDLVLGTRLAQRIFGHLNVVGQTMQIEQDLFRVVGVVGGISDLDLAHAAFAPLTTVADRLPGFTQVDKLYIRCQTWDDVEKVAAAIPGVIQTRQPIDRLRVDVSWEALKHTKKVAWWVESFIYLAFSATLALGGVGIWNVMMAAVRSRTREIGLKKAMGAEDRDILAQFLTEALCLSLGSAVLGIALGRLLVEGVSLWLGSRPPEDLFWRSLAIGLLFAAGLGVGAGLYPSLQASRMEVVSATRYE
jgi:putative ABC transport system permease protein